MKVNKYPRKTNNYSKTIHNNVNNEIMWLEYTNIHMQYRENPSYNVDIRQYTVN